MNAWEARVDELVVRMFGVGLSCLPDVDTASAYEAGLTPEEALEGFLDEWGYDG